MSEYVSVVLVVQHAMPMRGMWPALLYNIFPDYLINGTILEITLLNAISVF